MTEAIAFDAHHFVKHLTDGGFAERQGETLAEEPFALITGNLPTKANILKWFIGAPIARAG